MDLHVRRPKEAWRDISQEVFCDLKHLYPEIRIHLRFFRAIDFLMNYMLYFNLKDTNYQQKQLQLVKEEEFAMEDERISIYFNLQTMLPKLDRLLPVYNC